ncbi:MAG: flagellar basal body P-ring formation chaperone FlgA [Desulfurivibrio sp.]|nr:flagellar basal body P-ring formation chaperone FlgA [Desulfurivibrio sp.]
MSTKRLLLLIPLLLGVLLPPVAAAEQNKITLGSAELAEIFATIIHRESVWSAAELEIDNFTAHPAEVRIPAGILDYRLENEIDPGHVGRHSLQVALLVNGAEATQVRLNADLQRMGEVVMSARRINRGEVINPADLLVERRNISNLNNNFISDPEAAVGKQPRTTLQPGAVLYQNRLEKPPLVRRGDRVEIIAQHGRIRVSAPGEVRDIGAEGELVRVRNLMSRREIQARVIDSGTVKTIL